MQFRFEKNEAYISTAIMTVEALILNLVYFDYLFKAEMIYLEGYECAVIFYQGELES